MPPSDAASDPFVVLALDSAEREYAALRLVAAAVTLGASIALALLEPDLVGWACAAAGGLFALMWIGLFARGRRMSARAHEHFLALEPSGLALAEGRSRAELPWDEVTGVRVDEDRLVVEVARRDDEALSIHPRYGGLGLYELERAVVSAWEASRKVAS